jgi:hypothetical protein
MDRSEPPEPAGIPELSVRCAAVGDIASLLALELSCWPEPLRATGDELKRRIPWIPRARPS